MWLYRDTNGALMMTPSIECPLFDNRNGVENGRWLLFDDRYPARSVEVNEDDFEDYEVTFENSPVHVVFDKI